ncbi:MAG: lamin tail domain-containing protein [Bacteroidota bacterium]
MHKILLFLGAVFIPFVTMAQFTENFSDGDFTSNPIWTGDVALFKVNAAFQLQLNATGDATATLAVPITSSADMEWSCWAKLPFAPSDNNMARVYLSSDQQDLKSPLNGYYIKLGESGSSDAIELVRQSGSTHTVVCRGTEAFIAASFAIKVKVVRTNGGNWKVYADASGGNNYQLQASGIDNTFTNNSYSGVYCKFTSSNSTKFYFDDFYAGPIVVDNTPPAALSAVLESSNTLSVTFSEAVELASATNLNNYSVTPGGILPGSAAQDVIDPSVVHLTFSQAFTPDVSYTLSVANVKDLAGNVMTTSQFPFARHRAKTFDVLVNEIMADPTPTVSMPDAEYIELYNRSAFPVELKNWELLLGSSLKLLPQYTVPAGGYVILCDDGSKPLLEPFGPVIDFSSFAVTNTGSTITLKDYAGNVIHSVSYSDAWYQDSYKKEGGWSLEMIDPLNPCGEAANWKVCNNNTGGTPGKINSVNAPNPDNVPPAISRVGVNDALHITVWFTESCDSIEMAKNANYSIDNGIGNPASVLVQSPGYSVAYLTLPSSLAANTIYTLTGTGGITDCAGNPVLSGTSYRFAIPVEAAANDIVINELLFDPVTGCVDFVEIYNRSTKVIDLKSLILANYDTIGQVITKSCEISAQPFLSLPGDYFALSTDSSAVRKFYKTTNPAGFINMATFPTMNNEDGVVAIAGKGGMLLDLVTYTAAMQYPLLTSVDGVSLERISPERLSDDVTNWHSASEAAGYGTPGYKNSQFGVTITDNNEISLSPDIFSPDNDGYNDVLNIAYTFGASGNNATITIYDASGRLVRNLVNQELCGTTGVFSWDGITNDKLKASIGRYIIFVEIFDLQGNVKRYKKSTILGGKL